MTEPIILESLKTTMTHPTLLKEDSSLSNKVCLLGSSLLLHILSLALPLTMMQVYDRILLNRSTATLTWLVLGCSIAIIMECILKYSRTKLGNLLATRFENASSIRVLRHLLNTRLVGYEQNAPSVYLERLKALPTLKNFYSGQLYQVILDLPFSLVFLVTIAYLGSWVVLVPLLAGITYIGLVFYCRSKFDLQNQDEQNAHEKRQSFLLQLLDSLPTVKGLNLEEQMLRRFERLQSQKVGSRSKTNTWAELPGLLGPSFSQLTMFGTILLCSRLVLDGQMTLGGLTACMMLSSRALQPLQQSASFWIKLPAVKEAKNKIAEIEAMEIEREQLAHTQQPHDLEGEIYIKNLSFRYSISHPFVFSDIELHIPSKAMVGITGPSKNGSTTLLMLMMGLLESESGQINIDGYPLQQISKASLEGKVQYLSRNGILFKGSILDNISSFKPHRQALALSTATLLGLDPLIALLPQGYETQVDSRSKISMEIIHRISLARSLVSRPRILLVDKTTASMDLRSEQVFLDLLEKLRPLCTIVIVSQWPYLLSLCDDVYELKDGAISIAGQRPSRGVSVS